MSDDGQFFMNDILQPTFSHENSDEPFYYVSTPSDINHWPTDVPQYPPFGNALVSNTIFSNLTVDSCTDQYSTSPYALSAPVRFPSMHCSSWTHLCEHSPGMSTIGNTGVQTQSLFDDSQSSYDWESVSMDFYGGECRDVSLFIFILIIVGQDQPSPAPTQTIDVPSINDLLEQFIHDLSTNQPSIVSTLKYLIRLLGLSCKVSETINYHFLFVSALRIWERQFKKRSTVLLDESSHSRFAMLLCLFYSLVTEQHYDGRESSHSVIVATLVTILQEKIHRVTGMNRPQSSRLTAIFMKSFAMLAQHCSDGHQ